MKYKRCYLKSKLFILFLVFTIIFGINVNATYAGPQEDLDKGFVTMTSNGSITLRANEVYYIAVRGGKGGRGGSAPRVPYRGDEYNEYGSNGSDGNVSYFKLDMNEDTIINLFLGNSGGTGGSGNLSGSIPSGGHGGSNSSGLGGNGSSGTSPNTTRNGAGGGGGGATVVTFTGSTNRLTAAGGSGGSGAQYRFQKSDDQWYYYPSETTGSGGSGGSLSYIINDTSKATITPLSSSEGAAYVAPPTSSGMTVRKQRKLNGDPIPLSDIQTGESILLSNSVDGAITTFTKQSNGTFKWANGATYYYTYTSRPLEWFNFSKYAVSGSGSNNTITLTLKSDLSFVGGDGSVSNPYYPEPAGSIGDSGGGGISDEQSVENTELLSRSIISVANQIETLLNYEKEKDILEQNKVEPFVPFTVDVVNTTNASATKLNNATLLLKVNGRPTSSTTYNVSVNNNSNTTWTDTPSDGKINVELVSGYNSIMITVQDNQGNTVSDVINVWKLD